MEFRTFDLLTKIVPGILIMLGAFILFYTIIEIQTDILDKWSGFSAVIMIVFLTISYLIGYINEAVSSILEELVEPFLKHPSYKLLKTGISKNRIYINEPTKTKESIRAFLKLRDFPNYAEDTLEQSRQEVANNREVYRAAKDYLNVYSEGRLKERLIDFSDAHIFSRNILLSFGLFGALVISAIAYVNSPFLILGVLVYLVLILLLFSRYRLRYFSHVREVLIGVNNYQKEK